MGENYLILIILIILFYVLIKRSKDITMNELNLSKSLDKFALPDKEIADLYIGDNQNGEEIIFYVAQAGSTQHEKAQRKYSKELERARKNPKKTRLIFNKIIASSILTGWKGLIDDNGTPVENTFDNRLSILNKYKQISNDVMNLATDNESYLNEEDEEVMSESEALSDTAKN